MKSVGFFFLLIFFLGFQLLGTAAHAQVVNGYTQDVDSEREQDYYEIYLVPPHREYVSDYRGLVFNHQLTTEFRQRYVERFGYIDNNSVNYTANQFTQGDQNRGSVEVDSRNRRAYGEYMMRRLGEWHLDNFVKSEPSVRPLYEAKERLSNVSVEMGKQTRAKMAYSFSDNSAELVLENPYCDSKLRIEMDPTKVGPSAPIENRLYIGKSINKLTYVNSQLAEKDGVMILELQRQLAPAVGSAFSVSQPYKEQGFSARETRINAGVSHWF